MDAVPDMAAVVNPGLRLRRDNGCMGIETSNPNGNPVELAKKAAASAHALPRLAAPPR